MKKNTIKLLLFCAIIMSFSFSASAWDDTGHKISAYIAWQQMSPAARERAIDILLKAPEDSDLSVFYLQDSRSAETKKLELFMIASTWADIVRNKDFKVRFEKYNQGDWHYADIFWKQENGKAEILKDFPEESGKAIPKLSDFDKILRDTCASDADRAIALAWFLHVGGDVHNPLHNASRVTDIEPKGDQGGNKFLLTPEDAPRKMNLHYYWDSIFTRDMPRLGDTCDTVYIADIAAKIMKSYPYLKLDSRLNLGDYQEWNKEGFALLNTDVYAPKLKRGEMPSKQYQENTFKIGEEQIALAGYRLGETLNSIFAGNTNVVVGK